MAKTNKFDFSGFATKYNLKCSDERTILKDAFKGNDGGIVPLVWQHLHNDPANVLGHALLENREDGVYSYCTFNDTPSGQNVKKLVEHGDVACLSIYANGLVQKSKNVVHGIIRELSIVLAGANPGAVIDNLSFAHEDGSTGSLDDEAIIYTGSDLELAKPVPEVVAKVEPVAEVVAKVEPVAEVVAKVESAKEILKHADDSGDETIGDIFETLSEKQKTAVYAIIGEVAESNLNESLNQSSEEGDNSTMKHNVFDGTANVAERPVLTHEQFQEIVADAIKCGSFKESFLQHVQTYGIENIDYLFPDAKTIANSPAFYKRDTGWVGVVINGTYHTPFSRIKTLYADITADAARALGYVKGNLKKEEVIRLLKRITTPTTVYKKQKLDRDDIVDITDLDVVAWLKAEMRLMLDEELARAVLVSDGRAAESQDKINEENIRPIWKDDDMYAHKVPIAADATVASMIDSIILARKNYKGSGEPIMFTTADFVANMLLIKDTLGRRIYSTMAELESALRVSKIVEVPVMEGQTRITDDVEPITYQLLAIMVNLRDYAIGADRGGAVSMFDDFDIDYNQYKYLMEARCSGALTIPKAALVVEQVVVP